MIGPSVFHGLIVEAALKNRTKRFVIDDEAVVLSLDGMPDFNALHSGKHNDEVQFCAFDVLALDGEDLRNLPLSMRKTNLERLLRGRPDGTRQSIRERRDRSRSIPRSLRHGVGRLGL
jgi:ATP-dependent DNA ligase